MLGLQTTISGFKQPKLVLKQDDNADQNYFNVILLANVIIIVSACLVAQQRETNIEISPNMGGQNIQLTTPTATLPNPLQVNNTTNNYYNNETQAHHRQVEPQVPNMAQNSDELVSNFESDVSTVSDPNVEVVYVVEEAAVTVPFTEPQLPVHISHPVQEQGKCMTDCVQEPLTAIRVDTTKSTSGITLGVTQGNIPSCTPGCDNPGIKPHSLGLSPRCDGPEDWKSSDRSEEGDQDTIPKYIQVEGPEISISNTGAKDPVYNNDINSNGSSSNHPVTLGSLPPSHASEFVLTAGANVKETKEPAFPPTSSDACDTSSLNVSVSPGESSSFNLSGVLGSTSNQDGVVNLEDIALPLVRQYNKTQCIDRNNTVRTCTDNQVNTILCDGPSAAGIPLGHSRSQTDTENSTVLEDQDTSELDNGNLSCVNSVSNPAVISHSDGLGKAKPKQETESQVQTRHVKRAVALGVAELISSMFFGYFKD